MNWDFWKGAGVGAFAMFFGLSFLGAQLQHEVEEMTPSGEWEHFSMSVKVLKDEEAVTQYYRQYHPDDPLPVEGFAWWGEDEHGDYCVVAVPAPDGATDRRRMETWGHELMHCVWGHWH